jgi:hypothetical protein
MNHNAVRGRRFERFLLGMGMSFMLFMLERRVMKMQRASNSRAGRNRSNNE